MPRRGLGLCSRFHIVALPDQFKAFEHPLIISVALAMYVVEFVADKSLVRFAWDTIHTVVRPSAAALVAGDGAWRRTPARKRSRRYRRVGGDDDALGKAGNASRREHEPGALSNGP